MRYSESKNLKQLNTVFKDTQKIYEGKQKTALISYVQKQHNVFESDKKLGDGGVHHYIISPLSPESYEKLTPEQKKIMENESIQWSKNTFEKFGFIGALEYNSDKSDKQYSNGFQNTKQGYHLHLAGVFANASPTFRAELIAPKIVDAVEQITAKAKDHSDQLVDMIAEIHSAIEHQDSDISKIVHRQREALSYKRNTAEPYRTAIERRNDAHNARLEQKKSTILVKCESQDIRTTLQKLHEKRAEYEKPYHLKHGAKTSSKIVF